jgi:catechol 2,3-dioxygenase-like lactoylglutathione lyase family enzyme
MTLGGATLVAFLATVDPERAKLFYRDALGLDLIEDTPFALVFDAAGTTLRIQKVERLAPHPFTSLGWNTADIATTVHALRKKGIVFERFAGMSQDENGIWRSPSGAKVAWFRDPDGNLLSLTELP